MLNHLKYILLIGALLTITQVKAQYVIDKVCQGASRNYKVEGEAGSTYKWTVKDAMGNVTILPETTPSVINYIWNQAPGTYQMAVVQISAAGCDSIQQGEVLVVPPPFAFAGTNAVICAGTSFHILQDSAAFFSHISWNSSGDGTFDNDTILHPVYTPGPADVAMGMTTLTITAQGMGYTGSCLPAVSSFILNINNLQATAVAQPVTCFGNSDGIVTITASGGDVPYNYTLNAISNGSGVFNGLPAGDYIYTVSEKYGCSFTDTVSVAGPALLTATIAKTDAGCSGTATGSIDLTVSGGNAPYTFAWNTGATTEDLASLVAGAYSVTVTDSKSCQATANALITETTSIVVSEIHKDASCNGRADGNIDATVTGGTPPYNFSWNNGAATEDLNNVAAGNYTLNITDAIGCVASLNVTIGEYSNVTLAENHINAGCFGSATGSINLTVLTGTAPFTYAWSNGETSEDISALKAGAYSVTVTDQLLCSATLNINITDALPLALSASVQDAKCFNGNSGMIDLTVSGGTPPYTYAWSNGALTEDVNNLFAGLYKVIVTDQIGCVDSATYTVNEPVRLSLSESHTDVSCNGGFDGGINLTVAGGTSPYSYSWSNGKTTEDISDLFAGTYTVNVNDANGCTETVTVTITESAGLVLSSTLIQASCNGNKDGSIDLDVTGGTAPYQYLWNTSDSARTQDIANIGKGTYTVVVTDDKGCKLSRTETIIEANAVTITETHVNAGCYLCSQGSITLTATGGTKPYSFLWNTGDTTSSITNLPAGTYFVTVTDNAGCIDTLSVTLTQAPPPVLAATAKNVSCYGGSDGSIDLTITGGTAPYTQVWSNGQTTEDINNLPAGDYSVTVTDSIGSQASLSITLTQPEQITLQWASASAGCVGGANGSIDMLVVGGTGAYTYKWSNGKTTRDISGLVTGSYSVVVTDSLGCTAFFEFVVPVAQPVRLTANIKDVTCKGTATGAIDLMVENATSPYVCTWSNGTVSEDITSLVKGTYKVSVVDAKGCTASALFTVKDAPAILIAATITKVKCFGGNNGGINLTVTGGKAPYSYLWYDGSTASSISGVPAGSYFVQVTDSLGCIADSSIVVTQNQLLTVTPQATDVSCFGSMDGSIKLKMEGGEAPYIFQWLSGQTTQNINDLQEGIYLVNITDNAGCTVSAQATIHEPSKLVLSESHVNTACGTTAIGSIDLAVNGGTAPYTYKWSNNAKTEDIHDLAAGTYIVTVTDQHKCEASLSVEILGINNLTISETHQNVSCFGAADGTINITASGAQMPVTFIWGNGAVGSSLTNLPAGTYRVRATDAYQCTAQLDITITEPAPLAITDSIVPANCNGGAGGAIYTNVTGGTIPYSYTWSNGKQTRDITNLKANEYFVTVTDANGCSIQKTFIVPESTGLTLSETHSNPHCLLSDGSINLLVFNATQPVTFVWSNGATTEDISGLAAGAYTVTATDALGCTGTLAVNLVNEASFTLTAVVVDASCKGVNNGSIDLNVTGGTAPFKYNWNNGATSQDIANLAPGTYKVAVSDANSCADTLSVVVGNISGVTLAETHVDASCSGIANGRIDITVTGGTSPYNFIWSTGATTQNITGLFEGLYRVIVIDANSCRDTLDVALKSVSEIVASTSVVNISCYGGNEGSVNLTVSGGTLPYQFSWSSGDTTQNLVNKPAGIYTVTITDKNGCNTKATATIAEPNALSLSLTAKNASCDGSNGTIIMAATGGNAPYSYSIDGDNSWQTSASFAGLAPGAYEARVKDANGCEVIYPAPVVIVNVTGPAITHLEVTDAVEGKTPGTVSISATGITMPLMYSIDGITWQTDTVFNGLAAGIYTAYVKDGNGCLATQSFEVQRIVIGKIQLTSTSKEACLSVTIDVPVYATSGFTNITAFHVELTFEPRVLRLITIKDIHSNLGTGSMIWHESKPGTLAIDYKAPEGTLVSIPSDNLLFGIEFNSLAAGDGKLSWNELNCTFTALGSYEVPSIYTIGKVQIIPMPKVVATGAGDYCEHDSLTLSARTFDPQLTLEWVGPFSSSHTGETWPLGDLTAEKSGLYVVTAKNSAMCQTEVLLPVNVHPRPEVQLPYDTLCLYRPVLLDPHSGQADYEWTLNNSLVSYNNTYLAEKEGLYEVNVTNQFGCSASDKIYMDMCEIYIAIPNAFTPNADGLNDTFKPFISQSEPTSYVMKIYNKWGQLLFVTNNYKVGWDGTVNGVMSKPDVYVYSIEYTIDAKVHTNMPSPINGTFTLVR